MPSLACALTTTLFNYIMVLKLPITILYSRKYFRYEIFAFFMDDSSAAKI